MYMTLCTFHLIALMRTRTLEGILDLFFPPHLFIDRPIAAEEHYIFFDEKYPWQNSTCTCSIQYRDHICILPAIIHLHNKRHSSNVAEVRVTVNVSSMFIRFIYREDTDGINM